MIAGLEEMTSGEVHIGGIRCDHLLPLIRPEHITLSDSGPIRGAVMATEMLGSETNVFANLESGENITASIRGIRNLPQGAIVRFSIDRRFVHVFDE